MDRAIESSSAPLFDAAAKNAFAMSPSTPMTTLRYTGNGHGWRAPSTIMARALFTGTRWRETRPGLENFYMAGQWAGVGGVPPVAAMDRDLIRSICRTAHRTFITCLNVDASIT